MINVYKYKRNKYIYHNHTNTGINVGKYSEIKTTHFFLYILVYS
jgi:hypothetical protein